MRGETWSDFTRDETTPLNGTFPYYSDGVVGESYGPGDYKATNGRLYKVSASGAGTPLAWYPAPGLRSNTSGALDNVGYEGSSWASSTEPTLGTRLFFYVGAVEPERLSWRAGGYQLRCLSE